MGENVTAGAVATPTPVKLTVCGLFAASSVKVKVPVRVPVAVGVNVTPKMQLVPAAICEPAPPQPFELIAKSPLAVGVAERVTVSEPVL